MIVKKISNRKKFFNALKEAIIDDSKMSKGVYTEAVLNAIKAKDPRELNGIVNKKIDTLLTCETQISFCVKQACLECGIRSNFTAIKEYLLEL